MFGLFKKQVDTGPLDEHTRTWMEQVFLWLVEQFGENVIKQKPTVLP